MVFPYVRSGLVLAEPDMILNVKQANKIFVIFVYVWCFCSSLTVVTHQVLVFISVCVVIVICT